MPHCWVLCIFSYTMALSRNIVQSSFFKRYQLRFSKHGMDQNCSAIRCCRWLRWRWLFQFYSLNPQSKQNILQLLDDAWSCLVKIWNPSSIRPKSAKHRYCSLDWCAVFGSFGQWCQGNNRPFAASDHVVENRPCWRASSLLFPQWDIKTKRPASVSFTCLCFDVPVRE